MNISLAALESKKTAFLAFRKSVYVVFLFFHSEVTLRLVPSALQSVW